MKKLFMVLGVNATLILTGTTKGDFKLFKDSETGKILLKKVQLTGNSNEYFNELNIQQYTVVTQGDETTGAGYVAEVTFKEQGVAQGTQKYSKITITTNDWLTATFTAQLCNEAGVVKGEVKEKAAPTNDRKDLFMDLVNKEEPVTGKTNLTLAMLEAASQKNGPVDITLYDANRVPYMVVNIQITEAGDIYSGTYEDVNYTFAPEGTEVLFTATSEVGVGA
jgi:hypothetical protein